MKSPTLNLTIIYLSLAITAIHALTDKCPVDQSVIFITTRVPSPTFDPSNPKCFTTKFITETIPATIPAVIKASSTKVRPQNTATTDPIAQTTTTTNPRSTTRKQTLKYSTLTSTPRSNASTTNISSLKKNQSSTKQQSTATTTVKKDLPAQTLAPSTPGSALPRTPTRPAFQYDSGHRLVMYHVNWACYERAFNVVDLLIDYMSDVNYAFFDLVQDPVSKLYLPDSSDPWADFQKRFTTPDIGVLPLDPAYGDDTAVYGNFGQFIKLREAGKKFNFGVSVGGWSSSVHYSTAMRTQVSRQAFVDKIMYWTKLYPTLIDRWDLDWEYISSPGQNYGLNGNVVDPSDSANFGFFLETLRNALDAAGFTNVEISACTTSEPDNIAALPIKAMIKYLDTFNVMTYDFKSSEWGPTLAGHNSNLVLTSYASGSVQKAAAAFIAAGVPASKINIGVPFYTRGFANTAGLGKPSNGQVKSFSWEAGMSDYKALPWPGAKEFYDKDAVAAYTYDPITKDLLSYDNVEVVNEKLRFMWDLGLKGIIVWESSGDFKDGNPKCLTKALFKGMQARP